jgi:hypothetical protein
MNPSAIFSAWMQFQADVLSLPSNSIIPDLKTSEHFIDEDGCVVSDCHGFALGIAERGTRSSSTSSAAQGRLVPVSWYRDVGPRSFRSSRLASWFGFA